MTAPTRVTLSPALAGLLGLARRAGQLIGGFEAVRRELMRGRMALVLVDEELSDNTLAKVRGAAAAARVPVVTVAAAAGKPGLNRQFGKKILALHSGSMADGIVNTLKQEHQWR